MAQGNSWQEEQNMMSPVSGSYSSEASTADPFENASVWESAPEDDQLSDIFGDAIDTEIYPESSSSLGKRQSLYLESADFEDEIAEPREGCRNSTLNENVSVESYVELDLASPASEELNFEPPEAIQNNQSELSRLILPAKKTANQSQTKKSPGKSYLPRQP